MKFSEFSKHLEKIEKESSRLKITALLAELFAKVTPEEGKIVANLCMGRLAPKFADLEFNLAEKTVLKVIGQTFDLQEKQVKQIFLQFGDLGDVVFQQKSANITFDKNVEEVYQILLNISKEEGLGSQQRKALRLQQLLVEADQLSAKYLVRIVLNKLRLGFSELTILDSLSWLKSGDKTHKVDLEKAFNIYANIGEIVKLFLEKGMDGVKNVKIAIGVPIRVAKATAVNDLDEIFEKMQQKMLVEPKYDGFRAQIHIEQSQEVMISDSLFGNTQKKLFFKIFSRNLDNLTNMFPELRSQAQDFVVKNLIFDAELVAFDPRTKKTLDFQETIKRRRKHNVSSLARQIPIKAFVFDILYLNDKSLIQTPLSERRQILEDLFAKLKQNQYLENFVLSPQERVDSQTQFLDFFAKMQKQKMEGMMVKKIDGIYQAGARNFTWIKYKIGMQSGLADTVDAVVLGYFKGQGKWAKFGMGKLLIGLPSAEKIIAISKVGSGLSEESLVSLKNQLDKLQIDKPQANYVFDQNLVPDVWVKPQLIVEIRADSVSKSPLYASGYSLRFPRFIKVRKDKSFDEATSVEQLQQMAK